MSANHEYVAAYLADLFGRLCPLAHVDVDAAAFGHALETGSLPPTSVSPDIHDMFVQAKIFTASVHCQNERASHTEKRVRVCGPETYGLRALELMDRK